MKVGGQIPWNAFPICETSQICYLMGRRYMKDRRFGLRRTSQESINLERKSYLDCSSDTHCTRDEFGRVTYWLQTLRCWRRWTHRKSTQKRLNAKEVIFQRKRRIYFSNRRWTNQTPWRRSRPENIHLDTAAINSRRKSC